MSRFLFRLAMILCVILVYQLSMITCPCAGSGQKADKVLIEKGKRRLTLFRNNKIIKTYTVSLGRNPEGKKIRQGDARTPEGKYTIDSRNSSSRFYKALHISYPSREDRERARSRNASPGGDIMIHGMKNGLGWLGGLHRFIDWTQGCIAVTNDEMDEIWELVPTGTPVEIVP